MYEKERERERAKRMAQTMLGTIAKHARPGGGDGEKSIKGWRKFKE
jgi:hypothetical protein